MNQLERIVKMEANLSQAQTAIKKLQEALEVFKKSQPGIEELNKYLVSPEFKIDFKAAENGTRKGVRVSFRDIDYNENNQSIDNSKKSILK